VKFEKGIAITKVLGDGDTLSTLVKQFLLFIAKIYPKEWVTEECWRSFGWSGLRLGPRHCPKNTREMSLQ